MIGAQWVHCAQDLVTRRRFTLFNLMRLEVKVIFPIFANKTIW